MHDLPLSKSVLHSTLPEKPSGTLQFQLHFAFVPISGGEPKVSLGWYRRDALVEPKYRSIQYGDKKKKHAPLLG